MYLKSLSLYGFKTFARRTVLEMKKGVTAIVGPNGSGKSNLIDAIVWAMGEQSMKSIRGRKMEEVVFHGSETRKPLGFAEIVLTFDNEDGFFPLPHSEISVMRRHYRSGESEFEINREPCRLRDIQNLILDTGLGTTSYSIVNQGDVEYVIDLLPQQRREIFDEAAGINKYKIEKAKTLQKIKETDQNIARLKDILAEIEERLEPLREQSEKARRYEEIVEEIELLKLGVFLSDIRRLRVKLEQQTAEEAQTDGGRKELAGIVDRLREKQTIVLANIESVRRVVDEVLQELAVIGGKVGSAGETARLLQRSVEDLEHRMGSAQQEKEDIKKRITDLEDEIKQLGRRSGQKKKRLDEAQVEWDRMAGESTEDLRAKEQNLTAQRDSLLSKIKALNEKETEFAREVSVMRDRLRNVVSSISEREKNRNIFAGSNEKLLAEIGTARKEIESLEKEIEKKHTSVDAIQKELDGLSNEVEKRRSESEAAAAVVNSISARIDALEKMIGAIRPLSAKDGKAAAPLSDRIEIESGFESAVRRALNELLNAWPITKKGIRELLKEKKETKDASSTHLVADWLEGAPAPDLSKVVKSKNCRGILSDKVRIKSSEDRALAALFARFAVADSAEALHGMIDALPAGAGAVAADGSACFMDGVLYVGEALPTGKAVAERIDSLRLELKNAEGEAEKAKESLNELSKKLSGRKEAYSEGAAECQKLREKLAARRQRLETDSERAAFYGSELENTNEAVRQLNEIKGKFESEIGKAEASLEKIKEDKKKFEAELAGKQRELDEVGGLRRNKELIRSDLRVEIGELRRDTEAAEESAQYRRAEAERLKQRKTDSEKNIVQLQERIGSERREHETAAREAGEWTSKQEKATRNLEERRAALAKSLGENDDLCELIGSKEKEIYQLKELLLEIEVKRTRTETQLEETRGSFTGEFPDLTEEEAMKKVREDEPAQKGRYVSLRRELESLMPVNQLAIGEYEEKKNRHDLLSAQLNDLEETKSTLMGIVKDFDEKSRIQFLEIFGRVRSKFRETFIEMFGGGDADLILAGSGDPLEAGVDMAIQAPGKRMRSITLLSGGEKALCALVLIFSILKVRPSPFYILDEVDAGLDDANIVRFREMLKKYSTDSQFIIVTHNKGTLVGVDHFFGISLNEDEGFSKVLSVSID